MPVNWSNMAHCNFLSSTRQWFREMGLVASRWTCAFGSVADSVVLGLGETLAQILRVPFP